MKMFIELTAIEHIESFLVNINQIQFIHPDETNHNQTKIFLANQQLPIIVKENYLLVKEKIKYIEIQNE